MSLTKIIGLTVCCIGIVLLIFSISATQTVLESVVKWFAGYYTEHTMIALIAGIAMLVGGSLLVFGSRNK